MSYVVKCSHGFYRTQLGGLATNQKSARRYATKQEAKEDTAKGFCTYGAKILRLVPRKRGADADDMYKALMSCYKDSKTTALQCDNETSHAYFNGLAAAYYAAAKLVRNPGKL